MSTWPKRSLAYFFTLVLLGLFPCLAVAQDHKLKILVVDQQETPVSGVKIFVDTKRTPDENFFNSDSDFAQAISNDKGEVVIPIPNEVTDDIGQGDQAIGLWLLSNDCFYGTQAWLRHHVTDGNQLKLKVGDSVEDKMNRTSTVRVVSPAGEPVANAKIQIRSAYIARSIRLAPPSASKAFEKATNAEGEVTFLQSVLASVGELEITSDEFATQIHRIRQRPGTNRSEIQLIRTGKVKGQVKDTEGRVTPGLEFTLVTSSGPSNTLGIARIETDGSGDFSTTIAAGELFIEPPEGEESAFEVVPREPNQKHKVVASEVKDLALLKETRLTQVIGQVQDDHNQPVTGIRVSFQYSIGNRYRHKTAISDEQGKFNLALLPNDISYRVGQTDDLIFVGPEQVQLEIPDKADRRIELKVKVVGLEEVTGTVVDKDGKPSPNVRVFAKHQSRLFGLADTDQDGNFTTRLPVGVKFSKYDLWYGGTRQGKSTILSEQPLKLMIEKLSGR